jgi:hypothetical protein
MDRGSLLVVLARQLYMDHGIAVGVQERPLGGGCTVVLAALEIQLGNGADVAEAVPVSVHECESHVALVLLMLERRMGVSREVWAIPRASWRALSMLVQATGFRGSRWTISSSTSRVSLS